MANQGCPGEGSDTRLFGKVICFLQRACSWKSTSPPKWVINKLPTFGVAWPFYVVIQHARGDGQWRLFRFGWRYDSNWGGYIFPTAAFKITSTIMEKGY